MGIVLQRNKPYIFAYWIKSTKKYSRQVYLEISSNTECTRV